MNAFTAYIRDSLEELRLVQWSTRQQAVRLTMIVIVFIAINAAAFGLIDALFTQLIRSTIRA